MIGTTTETITPAKAKQWLEARAHNRPVNNSRVIKYGCDMLDSAWILNGESIKFDSDGRLIDGQHRLLACIDAQKPFETVVVRGIEDEDAFATIDVGEARTHGDIFFIAGFKDQNVLSAAAIVVYNYEKKFITMGGVHGGVGAKNQVTKVQLLEFASGSRKGPLIAACEFARGCSMNKFIPTSLLAALRYLFGVKSIEQAEKFLNDVGDGAGLTKTDSAYWLREKLISNIGSREKLPRQIILAYCITAWNKRRAGESTRLLKLGEEFPRVK